MNLYMTAHRCKMKINFRDNQWVQEKVYTNKSMLLTIGMFNGTFDMIKKISKTKLQMRHQKCLYTPEIHGLTSTILSWNLSSQVWSS